MGLCRFIGWLKNFISDRNHATENMIGSYMAATLVRRAPSDVKAALLSRWTRAGIVSKANKTFLQSAQQILGRSRKRAGMHEVHIVLAHYNSKPHTAPNHGLRLWFDNVERGLVIRELNSRGCLRKNGQRIVPQTYVSYYEGTTLRIGLFLAVFVGSRPSAPFVPGCAVCLVRRFRSSRIRKSDNFRDGGMLIASATGTASVEDYVCSTRLKHLYVRALWNTPNEENLFALVRMNML